MPSTRITCGRIPSLSSPATTETNSAHHWNQKSALYEEVVNIPFIVTLPGKKHAGTKLPQLISNGVDFFATVCDWAGAKLPEDADGKSFRKIAEEGNPQAPHQEYVITETQFDGSKTRGWMVRTARYKYVLYDKRKTPRTTVRHAERPGRDKKPDDGERLYESGAGTS